MWAVIQGMPPDVIAIYAMAGLAYSFVLVSEGLPLLKQLFRRQSDIAVHMLQPLLIVVVEGNAHSVNEETRGGYYFVVPSIAIVKRSGDRLAVDVSLWINVPGYKAYAEFGSRNDSFAWLIRRIREKFLVDFGSLLRRPFDIDRATVSGYLVFEFRDEDIRWLTRSSDITCLQSIPMEFVPPTLGPPRRSRGAPRYSDRLLTWTIPELAHGRRTVTRREAGGRRPGDPFPPRDTMKQPERVGMARR
jgi:hypothetical protein